MSDLIIITNTRNYFPNIRIEDDYLLTQYVGEYPLDMFDEITRWNHYQEIMIKIVNQLLQEEKWKCIGKEIIITVPDANENGASYLTIQYRAKK